MSEKDLENTISTLKGVFDYESFKDTDMVIEDAIENVSLKQQIFADLEKYCPPHCILASNTSTIHLSLIGERTKSQYRIVGAHFFSPAQPGSATFGNCSNQADVSPSKHLGVFKKTNLLFRQYSRWMTESTELERYTNFMAEGDQTRAVEALGTNPPPAKIQKVIFLLRDHKCFVKYFEPRVASLGPIHHSNTKYQLGEKYKLKLANEFVQCCRKGINLLYEVAKELKQLRECFEEEVAKEYDDEALAWMLFLDGCAILHYIFCAAKKKFVELKIKDDSIAFAQQDLFLLKNQVPYGLLKLLMGLSEKEAELSQSIHSYIRNVTYQQTEPQQKQEERDPTHLLDLLRTTLLGPLPPPKPNSSSRCPFARQRDPDWQSFRNVQELKAAGIHLKRRKKDSCLRNMHFTRRFGFYLGYLWLPPPITVDDSTGPKFMNLIAYEMCLDFENDFGISSYISFLDSLIDEANDVKDLKKARVLLNFLGSDQEVADLFNAIGTDVVLNADASPWTVLAFLGVLLGLGLTATQTWYSIDSPCGPCDDFCKLKLP
ncbi:hypothetical protein FH972_016721 [Carpinus fangiana]|uniref:3-hydroxyacyl-CoA dehydrogenase NAD binding domain-containing protein n=1 Tax=Carpinus fangiana TaxID=176857 RepID=A0A5N6RJN2_9ROSI|nr:hypothetical protein FH972_016721 [Carpinus fangiana]